MGRRDLLYLQLGAGPDLLFPELSTAGWELHLSHDVTHARDFIESREVLVGLAFLENGDGTQARKIKELCAANAETEWIALLDPACLRAGWLPGLIADSFRDYHTTPVDSNRLLFSLGHAYGMARMARTTLNNNNADEKFSNYEMVGTSLVMQQLFRDIRKVASVDAPVLITGESGTGKELAAHAIHERSHRANGRFVAVNCGALPPNLIQSELFGHERGAFTGAQRRHIGHIESAAGGTLFLDEIGDLSLDLQSNLLRFLQENTIVRVGGTEQITVDARIVVATHVNLEKAVTDGRFREDLYYRLQVLRLHMPALQARQDDIELLARFFFEKFSRERRHKLKGFSEKALQAMRDHDWPGNVRELINRVRRAIVMSDQRLITPQDLGLEGASQRRPVMTLDEARTEAERLSITRSLEVTRGNISRAARRLGVSRVTLYRLMGKYGVGA